VLNAKQGEIKAKATGSATTCEFFKNLVYVYLVFDQNPLIAKNVLLWGEKFDYWRKGGAFAF
jgi:hypothetical protein